MTLFWGQNTEINFEMSFFACFFESRLLFFWLSCYAGTAVKMRRSEMMRGLAPLGGRGGWLWVTGG